MHTVENELVRLGLCTAARTRGHVLSAVRRVDHGGLTHTNPSPVNPGAVPLRTTPGQLAGDSILGDFVIKPALDGFSNADMPQIVERGFWQLFATGEIEQPPRRVI